MRRSPDFPFDRFSTVDDRAWRDRVVVCIGGGPSLNETQIERVGRARARNECRVIAINDAYRLTPWADVVYFADWQWWERHRTKDDFQEFGGLKCSIEQSGSRIDDPAVHIIRSRATEGLPASRDEIATGQNSGFQALSIALHAAAARVILLGYDMRYIDGRTHWHNEHPAAHRVQEHVLRQAFVPRFFSLVGPAQRLGTDVVNATPGSALVCFRREELESLLPDPL